MNERAAAITGVGVIVPIGIGFEQLGKALAGGATGLDEIAGFDAADLPVQIAGEVRGFELSDHITSMKTYIDRASALALAASAMALRQSGWNAGLDGDNIGLCLGSAWGCEDSIRFYTAKLIASDPKFAPPLVFTHGYANAPNSLVSIEFGLRGHNACFAGGWAAGAAALENALDVIRRDGTQRLLAGGVDALSEIALRSAIAEGLASADLGRPFDTAADGLLLGEGAAILALESVESARNRKARAIGYVLGSGSGGGADLARAVSLAIERALRDAGVDAAHIGAVFASASGLRQVDAAEAAAIAAALPGKPPVVTLKGAMGDPMGAWAPVGVAAALCCMHAGELPANQGLRSPISNEINVPRETTRGDFSTCLVLNTSPGGYAAATVVGKAEG